jgi:pyruvate formate lyase activating enzyme
MRCYYCHNNFGIGTPIPEEVILDTIKHSPLDYVIISGGEPTIHAEELLSFVEWLKHIGKKVGVHTNGTNLQSLKDCKFDYIAMDIKAPLDKYELVTSSLFVPSSKVIKYVREHPHTFRCTLNKHLTKDDEQRIIDLVGEDVKFQKEN